MRKDAAFICVAYGGDSMFLEGQEILKQLERRWSRLTKGWKRLLYGKALGGFLGFGREVDGDYLHSVLHRPARYWPSGLTEDEKKLLMLARSCSAYHPEPDGLQLDRSGTPVGDDVILRALRRYAVIFSKEIAVPMWDAYDQACKIAGEKLSSTCSQVYHEDCSESEAALMWAGDIERGLAAMTLDASPATYEVLRRFLKWVSA